jgi:sugar phosphate permease
MIDRMLRNLRDIDWKAWFIVSCAGTFYSYQFIIRVFPNVMRNEILTAFKIDAQAFGDIISFYDWAYAFMQLPVGLLLDRFGPRVLMTVAALCCSFGCLIFAFTSDIYVASFARFLMGMGSACGFIGTLKLGTLWFPPHKLGQVIALTIIMGTLGAAFGGTPLSMLIDHISWTNALLLIGALGCGLSMLIYVFVTNTPTGQEIPEHFREDGTNIMKRLKRVLLAPQAWFMSLFSMLMYVPLTVWGVAWGVGFTQKIINVPEKTAAAIIGAMFMGAALGSPFFIAISDYFSSRRLPMIIGCLLAIAAHLVLLYFPGLNTFWVTMLFFLIGFSYTSKSLSFAGICEIMPKSISGVSLGFMNMIVMFNGAVLHPLIGKLLVQFWDGKLNVDGSPLYSAYSYRLALSIVPICLLASFLILLLIKETHPNRALGHGKLKPTL